MSLPLCDLGKVKVKAETCAVLEAVAQARGGVDRVALVREILEDWTDAQVHNATVILSALKREGLAGTKGD